MRSLLAAIAMACTLALPLSLARPSTVLAADATEILVRSSDLLEVVGMDADEIGTRAWAADIRLQELTPVRATLEEIFMDLTRDAVEYHAVVGAERELEAA